MQGLRANKLDTLQYKIQIVVKKSTTVCFLQKTITRPQKVWADQAKQVMLSTLRKHRPL